MAEHDDSINTLRMLLKRINSRGVKQLQRANEATDEPDWQKDPEGWRAYKQKQIDQSKRKH